MNPSRTTGRTGRRQPVPLPAVLILAFGLNGCSEMNVDQFKDGGPPLRLEDYFSGRVLAWGSFEDRFGTVRRQFFVEITGAEDDDGLTLHESFHYSDGEHQTRIWHIRPDGPNSYIGRAGDVIGEARGRVAGNALHWRYRMNLPIGGRQWEVAFDDWMLLQPDGVMLNRAVVTKWGVRLGEVRLFFLKPEAAHNRIQL